MIQTHLAAALIAAVLAFTSAWTVQGWRYDSMNAERLEHEREAYKANAKAADEASQVHEEVKVEIKTEFKTIYREVEKIVEKPVYRDNVCFDASGLQLISRAIANRPAPGEPSPAVP